MSLIVINWGPLKLAKIFRNNMLRFILSIKILCNLKYLWGVRLCVRSALVSCLLHLQQWESQSVQLSEELSTNTTPWPEHSLYQTDSKVRLYLSYPVSCVIISLQDCLIRGSLYIIHFPNFPNCQIVILEMWSISCVLTLIINSQNVALLCKWSHHTHK